MRGFYNALKADIALETWLLKQIEKELKRLPKGRLKSGNNGKAIYYREAKRNGNVKILSPDSKAARALTRRRFLEKQRDIIKNNLQVQKDLPQQYESYSHAHIMEKLSKVYQTVDLLAQLEVEHQRKEARMGEKKDTFHPENLKHVTRQGEIYRSKSEVIVSMILNGFRIPYGYEERVYWPQDAPAEAWEIKERLKIRDFYVPDFTYTMPDQRKIYHEHLGLMDKADYMEDFKKKLILYYWAGITPGDNLIITADDCKGRINQQQIAALLECVLHELIGTRPEA